MLAPQPTWGETVSDRPLYPSSPARRSPVLREFKTFLIKQNVLALAIAVVIGAALGKVIDSVVADFIMPIVGVVAPGGAWREWTLDAGPVRLGVGNFLNAVLNFL